MSSGQNFLRPVDIDEPPQLFFWEFSQFFIGVSLIAVGIIMGSGIGFILFSMLGFWYLIYAKRQLLNAKRGEFLHQLWAIGLRNDRNIDRFQFGIKNFAGRK